MPESAHKSLLSSTVVVSANTLASRVLGFVRDVVVARTFGASAEADAFFVAFRIPNLFRRLFAEGAFSQAFVPVLSQARSDAGDDAVRDLVSHVGAVLTAILMLCTVVGILAAPVLIAVFAPGFESGTSKHALSVSMLRICFPYLMFISVTSLCAGILNTYGRFGIPAFTPVVLNLCLIAAALLLAPHMEQPVNALAFGVFVAGVAQLALQLPFLAQLGMLVRPRWNPRHPGVRRIATLIVPALLGVSVAQLNILVGTIIASFLADGSVSWLYYSDRIMEFPLGVFGIALGTVILPSLSRDHAQGTAGRFADTLDWALRLVVLIVMPCAVGLGLLAVPVVSTLFQHGAFGPQDVYMAGAALGAYVLGLPGFVAVRVLAPGFYARQEMKIPVKVAAVAMIVNLLLSLALVGVMAHVGLALATSVAALVNALALLWLLMREGIYTPRPGWRGHLGKVLLANLVMAAVVLALNPETESWLAADTAWRARRLALIIGAGACSYLLVLLAVGVRPRQLAAPGGAQG